MKSIKIFAIAAAALVMGTSCSKENTTPGVEGQKAKITISVQPAQTRASGAITGDTDNRINNFLAFAFKANGQLDGAIIESTDGGSTTSTDITTAATEIYVVANASKILFANVNSKSDLEAVYGDLSGEVETKASTQVRNYLWASGSKSGIAFTESASNVYEATVAVPIKFVAARINVTVVNDMTEKAAVGAFTVTDVAVMNAVALTRFFGTPLTKSSGPGAFYYTGINMIAFANKPAEYSVVAFLKDSYVAGTPNHYYVFENDATAYPTILTLIASYDGGVSYCPIQFDLADAGKTIVRGNSYNVTLTLTGSADPNEKEDPGTVDPTEPIVKANIAVSVTVDPWIPQTINKEF